MCRGSGSRWLNRKSSKEGERRGGRELGRGGSRDLAGAVSRNESVASDDLAAAAAAVEQQMYPGGGSPPCPAVCALLLQDIALSPYIHRHIRIDPSQLCWRGMLGNQN